jgi:hypothetical protein
MQLLLALVASKDGIGNNPASMMDQQCLCRFRELNRGLTDCPDEAARTAHPRQCRKCCTRWPVKCCHAAINLVALDDLLALAARHKAYRVCCVKLRSEKRIKF